MLAVAWIQEEAVYVALSRGGNHFQVRRVDAGDDVSLAFSRANRLHVAYEQDGRILYRAADQGTHPADVAPSSWKMARSPAWWWTSSTGPTFCTSRTAASSAPSICRGDWLPQFVAYGTNPTVLPFYNEKELVLWGMPTGTYWFGIIMAAPYEGSVRLFRYLSWFNVWEQVAAFPSPPARNCWAPSAWTFWPSARKRPGSMRPG